MDDNPFPDSPRAEDLHQEELAEALANTLPRTPPAAHRDYLDSGTVRRACSSASPRPFTKADEGAKVNIRPQTVSVDGRIRHVRWDGERPESCTGAIMDDEVMMQGGRAIPSGIAHLIERFPDPLLHLAAPTEVAVLPSVTE